MRPISQNNRHLHLLANQQITFKTLSSCSCLFLSILSCMHLNVAVSSSVFPQQNFALLHFLGILSNTLVAECDSYHALSRRRQSLVSAPSMSTQFCCNSSLIKGKFFGNECNSGYIQSSLRALSLSLCVCVSLLWFDNRLLGVNLWWSMAHALCVRLQSSD